MSRVHVSSWSGGWLIAGFACPEPKRGGREGEREEANREDGRVQKEYKKKERKKGEWRKDLSLKASWQGAGCT